MSESLLHATSYLTSLQAYWWPFCRILAVLAMAPLFNHKALTIRVRVLLALAMTVALSGALPDMPLIDPLSARGVLTTLEQVAFGVLLGLTLQLVFTTFMVVGEVVSTQMGMSMARYSDPMNGVSSSSILYQVYFLALALMFFATDGHLVVVSVLFQSFVLWPVGSGLHYLGAQSFVYALSWVIAAAVLVTLPIVFCLTLVQFCFGLLNRISPSMNLFSLGFPMSVLMGLLCLFLTMPDLADHYLHLTRELLRGIGAILQEGQHG